MFEQPYGLAFFLYCLLIFTTILFSINIISYCVYILFKVYSPDVFFKLLE